MMIMIIDDNDGDEDYDNNPYIKSFFVPTLLHTVHLILSTLYWTVGTYFPIQRLIDN